MQNVCVTLNRIFIDPRCPVQITKPKTTDLPRNVGNPEIGPILDNSLNSVMNFTSFDIDEPSTFGPTSRANLGFEDELSFAGMPSVVQWFLMVMNRCRGIIRGRFLLSRTCLW